MLQYLVILLDDTSVSYCHADNPYKERRLISIDDLKAGILYAMKENLMIQFVYPDYELPQEYLEVIDTIDHHNIVPGKADVSVRKEADVIVYDTIPNVNAHGDVGVPIVLRLKKTELFASGDAIADLLPKVQRLNVVITDVETFTDDDLKLYDTLLDKWAAVLKEEYLAGRTLQFNLLTDRMMLNKPNHCNAGVENITLAPNGKFYLCPAFYYSDKEADALDKVTSTLKASSSLSNSSLDSLKNQQLLRLDHAPLCRHCDAYQCRRCVWLNRKTTLEVNTPSHEQCIVAHTERNASRRLLAAIREKAVFMPEIEIKEISYLDPFDVRKEW